MVKTCLSIRVVPIATLLLVASLARGATVSYTANLNTSKGNPVYDILILETDGTQVHATVYPSELPGKGISVISHDVPFAPTKTLVIGLTEGQDTDGSDKTELVMFLDNAFAAAHAGIPFSSIFAGARHSVTVANLQAAAAGHATQVAWFTDTFFPGPAAGAAFDSHGPFTVAEFTFLKIIGASAASGNWMITSSDTLAANDPNALDGLATEVISETAKIDTGPFDIAFTVSDEPGNFAADKTVLNNTGVAWQRFEMQLGTGSGGSFVPSPANDGLKFDAMSNNREETGAFPNVFVEEDHIVFTGFLPPGGTAQFVVYVRVPRDHPAITLRQIAIATATAAPALTPWSLAILGVLLFSITVFRLERRRSLRVSGRGRDVRA